MQAKVAATARAMGVDPALAQAVAFQESGFNHAVVSPANAIGTMQVIPSSGEWASELVGRQLNLLNPDDNVVAGVAILRALVAQRAGPADGDRRLLPGRVVGEAQRDVRGHPPLRRQRPDPHDALPLRPCLPHPRHARP